MTTRHSLLFAAAGVAAIPAFAGDLTVKVTLPEIPQTGPRAINKPYVAIWVRKDDNAFATNLAVWYQIEKRERRARPAGAPGEGGAPRAEGATPGATAPNAGGSPGGGVRPPRPEGQAPRPPRVENPKTPGGARWMNSVRQWWADSGNELQFPVDGLTSASRGAGTHEVTFAANDPKLATLAPGKYKLMVEASREHGGEEIVSVPFTWPAAKSAQTAKTEGKTELGAVELTLNP
ncbi:MAG: DUF2271 domain-containing protein [Steroidobacteraceae bacterium]